MNLNIKSVTVGQMAANCYLVTRDNSKGAVVIDPGDDGDYITEIIQKNELVPKAIILTHGHFDHAMAALALKLTYRIPLYMHQSDDFILSKMSRSAKHYLGFDPGPEPDVDVFLLPGSELRISDMSFEVIHTPGHTPGSVSLHEKSGKCLFSGDLFFSDGSVGRYDFSYSNKKMLRKSIEKIRNLDHETTVFPGHGESFLLGDQATISI